MIYDGRGRKWRRAIGFLPEYREVEEPNDHHAAAVDLVSCAWAGPDDDDDEIPEECCC